MKTYDIYLEGDDVVFQPSKSGNWVDLEEIGNEDIIALHPTCTWCDHCKEDQCVIDPDNPRKVDSNKHYCGYHTELV